MPAPGGVQAGHVVRPCGPGEAAQRQLADGVGVTMSSVAA